MNENDSNRRIEELTSWRTEGLREEDGILIASDHALETWIPWWHWNYSKYNSFPVTVADLGMSAEMKQWCERRWEVIPIAVPMNILKNRLPLIKTQFTKKTKLRPQKRYCWFRIPFALLKSPYRRTLYMDLDCLVRGKLDELFDYANNPYGVALAEDPRPEKIRVKLELGILKPGQKHFNCGVMPYLHGSELIRKWALSIIEKQGYYLGNQVFFLELLNELGIDLPTIPKKYNWLVPGSGISQEAVVLHFIEDAKEMGLGLVQDFNKANKSL